MADCGNNSEVKTNSGIPSNEEIIDSLASEFENSVIKDNKDVDLEKNGDSKTNNRGTKSSLPNNIQYDDEFQDSVDDISDDKSDKSDDYIDEVLLKDLEVGYSEEDKEVGIT